MAAHFLYTVVSPHIYLPHPIVNIVFLGAGNVACHLSPLFAARGHRIGQVWSRNIEHATELSAATGANPICRIDDIDRDADCYIIAIPDDHIARLSSQLPPVEGMVLHTSGSVPLSALGRLQSGVIWFPHSFVKGAKMDYSQLHCCYEGSSADVEGKIEELLDGVAQKTYRLASEERRWAHLASVMTNNFAHALNTLAEQTAASHGFDFGILLPLIKSTAENAATPNLALRQTGPAARHDVKTLDSHRRMLFRNPEALRVYNVMTELIQSLQKPSGA